MARPRIKLFYDNPLPDTLPSEEEWLHDYHRNSQILVEYLVSNGALSTAYHTAIRCLTQFREYLIDNGLGFSSENISRWCAENRPLVAGYEITLYRLLDIYQHTVLKKSPRRYLAAPGTLLIHHRRFTTNRLAFRPNI